MKHATIFATFFLLTCLGCHDQAANPTTDAPEKTPVEVATIHPQSVTDRLVLPARVTPDPTRVVHIYFRSLAAWLNCMFGPGRR